MHLFERFTYSLTCDLPGEMLRAQAESDILKDIHVGEEDVILENIAKGSFLGWDNDMTFAIKIGDACERDIPLFRMKQACQKSQNGTFAGAAFAQQNGGLAYFGSEAEVEVEGVEMSVELNC